MPFDRDALRRYLLGEAAESDAERLERDYFARETALEAVAEAEEDLIDDYLSGRLADGPRRRFESHYLASLEHRRRVAFVRALRAKAGPRRNAWLAPLMSLAAAMVVALLGALVWQRGVAPGAGSTVSVTLPAIMLRDGGASPEARIGPGSITLVIRFEAGSLPAPPPLEAAIRTVDGAEVWRGPASPIEGSPAGSPRLLASTEVPASTLAGGDYVIVLFTRVGGETRELQRSVLRVVRE
ncbi:MAG TPA: hypothetical protein VMQ62_00485 [Dongiaceae bacterium]|nr:hypothetical protein [Dongiaceae bacterium]